MLALALVSGRLSLESESTVSSHYHVYLANLGRDQGISFGRSDRHGPFAHPAQLVDNLHPQ